MHYGTHIDALHKLSHHCTLLQTSVYTLLCTNTVLVANMYSASEVTTERRYTKLQIYYYYKPEKDKRFTKKKETGRFVCQLSVT